VTWEPPCYELLLRRPATTSASGNSLRICPFSYSVIAHSSAVALSSPSIQPSAPESNGSVFICIWVDATSSLCSGVSSAQRPARAAANTLTSIGAWAYQASAPHGSALRQYRFGSSDMTHPPLSAGSAKLSVTESSPNGSGLVMLKHCALWSGPCKLIRVNAAQEMMAVCTYYSITTNQAAISTLFRVGQPLRSAICR